MRTTRTSRGIIQDSDIIGVRANHDGCFLTFERTYQQFRRYYRLLINGNPSGSLTDEKHARETVAYWRSNGWIAS